MECTRVREALLEQPDGPMDAALRGGVDAHLAGCDKCRRLQQALARLDDGLTRRLVPPALDAGFRTRLQARVARERRHVWADWIPAAVHFASCGAATAALVAYVPNRAGVVIAAAVAITLFGHFLLTAAQGALDAAGDTGY
ncbi:MAG TPA: zf-HC2 domain-containing protein [Vicinamibacterales bacterium]|jgi:predicted anti-sigma-YlaC factor YlaD|nr:zf-HC2 domain-containing protein [Vicinamibacterales bacterium]